MAALVLVGGGAVLAAGGDAGDPLISLSYLNDTYIPSVVKSAADRVDAATAKTYDSAQTRLKAQADLYLARAGGTSGGGSMPPSFAEGRYKRGDVITVDAGSGLMLLAGTAVLRYQSGTAVDVTGGNGGPLGHRNGSPAAHLAAEGTLLQAAITSDTAVLASQGYYTVTPSG